MNIKEINPDINDVKKIASLLNIAFAWVKTDQGLEYWVDVQNNLRAIVNAAEHKPLKPGDFVEYNADDGSVWRKHGLKGIIIGDERTESIEVWFIGETHSVRAIPGNLKRVS